MSYMTLEEELYGQMPDKLFISKGTEFWYACYDDALCILTNAEGFMQAYCYDEKPEYRSVRRHIVNEYRLREIRPVEFED